MAVKIRNLKDFIDFTIELLPRDFFFNFFTIIAKKRILDPMISSTRFFRVEHVARPIDLDRIQSLIKEKGLDPLCE